MKILSSIPIKKQIHILNYPLTGPLPKGRTESPDHEGELEN